MVTGAREKYHLSERQACRIFGQPRGMQRYTVITRADEDALTQALCVVKTIGTAEGVVYGRFAASTSLCTSSRSGSGPKTVSGLPLTKKLGVPVMPTVFT